MKLLYHIMCLLLMAPALCHAQGSVGYSYDAAGNRISRTIILSRNMAKKQARTMKDKEYTDILSQKEYHHLAQSHQGNGESRHHRTEGVRRLLHVRLYPEGSDLEDIICQR